MCMTERVQKGFCELVTTWFYNVGHGLWLQTGKRTLHSCLQERAWIGLHSAS
jgi:hypothetical protein